MPNSRAVALQLADLGCGLHVEHRQAARRRRDRVVRGRDGLATAGGRGRPRWRSPVNACGDVTSWTRWRSTARTAGAPGSWVTTWSVQILSTMVRGCRAWRASGAGLGSSRLAQAPAERTAGRSRGHADVTGARAVRPMHTGTTVPVRHGPLRPYNHRPESTCRPEGRTITDDRPPTATTTTRRSDLRRVDRPAVVRLRLFLALVTMFVIPIAIATPVVYALASGDGAIGHPADRRHRRPRARRSAASRSGWPGASWSRPSASTARASSSRTPTRAPTPSRCATR